MRQNPLKWDRSEVQALLFDVDQFTERQAKAWARAHGYRYGEVDTTDRYHRLRQYDPGRHPCRTFSFGDTGIKAVICEAVSDLRPAPARVKRQTSPSWSYQSNPVGDHVQAVSGPARGQRGVVRGESARVAQVEFESGRRGHVERAALRPRGAR
jgi:hypothetical protein